MTIKTKVKPTPTKYDKTRPEDNSKKDIVLVRYQDTGSPANVYVGYHLPSENGDNKVTIVNLFQNQRHPDSTNSIRKLTFGLEGVVGGAKGVETLERGPEVKLEELKKGELYEVEFHDKEANAHDLSEEGIVKRLVGCYAGPKKNQAYIFQIFCNVMDDTLNIGNLRKNDTTRGRRIYNKLRTSGIIKVRRILRKQKQK